jgi:hypothetical protein
MSLIKTAIRVVTIAAAMVMTACIGWSIAQFTSYLEGRWPTKVAVIELSTNRSHDVRFLAIKFDCVFGIGHLFTTLSLISAPLFGSSANCNRRLRLKSPYTNGERVLTKGHDDRWVSIEPGVTVREIVEDGRVGIEVEYRRVTVH